MTQAKRDTQKGIRAAAVFTLKVGFVTALLATAVVPSLGVLIAIPFTVLVFLAYLNAAKDYFVGECRTVGMMSAIFINRAPLCLTANTAKSNISIKGDEFYTIRAS